jgi:hypothetical protein
MRSIAAVQIALVFSIVVAISLVKSPLESVKEVTERAPMDILFSATRAKYALRESVHQ